MFDQILQQPGWLQVWIGWMVVVNTASFLFLRHSAAKWVAAAWVANVVLMNLRFSAFGYTRILGLSHVLLWTPLLVYLWRQRPWPTPSLYGRWLTVLFATNLLSLVVDYVDVIRYLAGRG